MKAAFITAHGGNEAVQVCEELAARAGIGPVR